MGEGWKKQQKGEIACKDERENGRKGEVEGRVNEREKEVKNEG